MTPCSGDDEFFGAYICYETSSEKGSTDDGCGWFLFALMVLIVLGGILDATGWVG